MILNIVAEVANQLKTYRPYLGIYEGKKSLSDELPADRIIWFPTTDTYEPTWNIGRNANEVYTRNVGIDFYIFSRDWNKIDDYINDLIISIYDKVHGPMFEITSGEWLDQGQDLQQGYGYILSVEISGIVIKRPLREVEIEEVSPHTHFKDSTEWVPDPPQGEKTMKYLSILLLTLMACGVTAPGALDKLQSGRCPDMYSCDVGYTCTDLGKKGMVCVKNEVPPPPPPKPDMGMMPPDMSMPEPPLDPQSLACFKKYFPGYLDVWYPKNWYQSGGQPMRGCVDCTVSYTSQKCIGRKMQEWDCMGNGTIIKFVENWDTQYPFTVVHQNGTFQDRYQGIENAGVPVCQVSTSNGICPGPYQYFVTWCEQYM